MFFFHTIKIILFDRNQPIFDHEHDESLTMIWIRQFKNLLQSFAIWPHQGWPTLFIVDSYIVELIVKLVNGWRKNIDKLTYWVVDMVY